MVHVMQGERRDEYLGLRDDHLHRPHPRRFRLTGELAAAAVARHAEAVAAGRPSYRDPLTGYDVLTAAHLAARGSCCSNGCRHCPYVGADAEP